MEEIKPARPGRTERPLEAQFEVTQAARDVQRANSLAMARLDKIKSLEKEMEEVTWQAEHHRIQVQNAHEVLDTLGAPRQSPAGTVLTLYGRLAELSEMLQLHGVRPWEWKEENRDAPKPSATA